MPQERYNLKWVLEAGVGIPFASKAEFVRALQTLSKPDTQTKLSRQCKLHQNRAIFEIPEILRTIIERYTSVMGQRVNASTAR
jgi:hypothetical protein